MNIPPNDLAKLGKMLNTAINPGATPPEREAACAAANKLCQRSNIMVSDVLSADTDDDLGYLEAEIVRVKAACAGAEKKACSAQTQAQRFRVKVARLEAAATKREVELQAKLDEQRQTIELMSFEAAELRERVNTLSAQRDGAMAARAERIDDTAKAEKVGIEEINQTEPRSTSKRKNRWSWKVWSSFVDFVSVGIGKTTIARRLSALTGRVVSRDEVIEMIHARWSRSSGRRFAMFSAG